MRICTITHHQLVNNPRLVREADALSAAGHEVRVISVKQTPWQSEQDAVLAAGRAWKWDWVSIEKTKNDWSSWLWTGLRKKIAKKIWNCIENGERLAGWAYTRTFSETLDKVLAAPTDLVIAHTQPMLAPAYFAAQKAGCHWGFDFEDILSEEYGEGISDPKHKSLVKYVEKQFIPRADYVTTASPCYDAWLAQNLGRSDSLNVNNVSALAASPKELKLGYPKERNYLSLYWFSQSLGPRRGLEDALRAVARLRVPAQLHLRGDILPSYEKELSALISQLGVTNKVFIHPRIEPSKLAGDAAQHDIGLALMQPCCLNHELAVPNKIFSYLSAGLAVMATRTHGHESVFKMAPDCGLLYTPGRPEELARHLEALAAEPEKLWAYRKKALETARRELHWESEQKKLLTKIESLKKAK